MTPALTRLATAVSIEELAPQPRLRFATGGLTAFMASQSMPAMTPDHELEPVQLRTRMGTNFATLALPFVVSVTVPAT